MSYPVYPTPWGHAPDGLLTKRDRMRLATGRFDAEGAARLAPVTPAGSLYWLAYRFVNTQTGEKTSPVPLGLVKVTPP